MSNTLSYEDAIIAAGNYAKCLSHGDAIYADTDYVYVKPFFELLPDALDQQEMELRELPDNKGFVVVDRKVELYQNKAQEQFYKEHQCPTCKGHGTV